jgi:phage baseplate assembly protein W|tara:strand:- start:21986 stop:22477 length:492 start_codon:yes stop_codon:yes gene_type:complete
MGTIKLSNLSVDTSDKAALKGGYLYKDLFLGHDMNRVTYNSQYDASNEIRDVQGMYDLLSIENSIKNIFGTIPGQKILSPTFGMDIRNFIFEPVTQFRGRILTGEIGSAIAQQEPRVQNVHVEVTAHEDIQEYSITTTYDIRSLDTYGISLKSVLNSSGHFIP